MYKSHKIIEINRDIITILLVKLQLFECLYTYVFSNKQSCGNKDIILDIAENINIKKCDINEVYIKIFRQDLYTFFNQKMLRTAS